MKLLTVLNNIELIQHDGDKVIWILLALLVFILAIVFISNRKISFKRFGIFKGKKLIVKASKNKMINPSTIILSVENKEGEAVLIESVIVRFTSINTKRAFKLTSVSGQKIYPMYLGPQALHSIVISLDTFFNREPALKNYFFMSVEANIKEKGVFASQTMVLNFNPFIKQ